MRERKVRGTIQRRVCERDDDKKKISKEYKRKKETNRQKKELKEKYRN